MSQEEKPDELELSLEMLGLENLPEVCVPGVRAILELLKAQAAIIFAPLPEDS